MAINVRNKGQRGEREAADLLNGWSKEVTEYMSKEHLILERNLMQTRVGGYDLSGIQWLALEIKRQENLSIPAWWRQTLSQAGPDQIPMLMYRQSRQPWRFMIQMAAYHQGPLCSQTSKVVVTMDAQQAKIWFQMELFIRLQEPADPDITE